MQGDYFLSLSFADLGLTADLTRAVADAGYTQPTPIQTQAIPPILQGRDVLAEAQPGTGKTAAFMLPLLQRLTDIPPETLATHIRALIITPTRELAIQVEDSVRDYGGYLPLRSTAIFGGVNMGSQIEALRDGIEILVATPGRLLDHVNEQTVDLSHVEMLVLDEADRILDMGFLPDMQRVLATMPQQRQTLLFASECAPAIRELATELLHDPIELAAQATDAGDDADAADDADDAVSIEAPAAAPVNSEAGQVAQRVLSTGQDRKRALLTHLIKKGDWKQVLVFTRTKHGANRLAHQLGRTGISATAVHGNKGQGTRLKALDDFVAGKVRVLVATDLAARGLDIEAPARVVNYDLPQAAEDYVQRIGRTGAGGAGEAISLVAPEELPLLSEVEKLIGRTLEQTLIPGFEPGSVPPNRQPRRPQAGQPAAPTPGDGNGAVPGNGPAAPTNQPNPPGAREGGGRNRRRRGRNRNGDGQNVVESGSEQPIEAREPGAAMPGMHPGQARMPNQPRGERGDRGGRGDAIGNRMNGGNGAQGSAGQNGTHGQSRRQARHDDDNRGNRDTGRRDKRNTILDDDFGNRIPPVKVPRGIRARILAGDIDEELDNIGNRMPPPPKHARHHAEGDDEDEINYNVALPAPAADDHHEYDGRQPMTNATQMFPSSAGFMGEGRGRRSNGGGNNGGGANGNGGRRKRRRGGAQAQGYGNGQAQGQSQGQPHRGQHPQQPHQGQQRHAQRHGKSSAGGQGNRNGNSNGNGNGNTNSNNGQGRQRRHGRPGQQGQRRDS